MLVRCRLDGTGIVLDLISLVNWCFTRIKSFAFDRCTVVSWCGWPSSYSCELFQLKKINKVFSLEIRIVIIIIPFQFYRWLVFCGV